MRVVAQRVKRAEVRVGEERVAAIGPGLLLYAAFRRQDGQADLAWMAEKVVSLRVFEDDAGKMNRSALDIGGQLLVVSQFTLYADLRRGRRPSWADAAEPGKAAELVDAFAVALERQGLPVATGVFGADMQVELLNDGPVTLVLDTDAL